MHLIYLMSLSNLRHCSLKCLYTEMKKEMRHVYFIVRLCKIHTFSPSANFIVDLYLPQIYEFW